MRRFLTVVALLAPLLPGCGHEARPVAERSAEVEWLKLRGPLGGLQLEVVVLLDGRPTPGILDTGASHTAVSQELALRLGLHTIAFANEAERLDVVDAHGTVSGAWHSELDSVSIGRIWLDKVPVTVMPMGGEVVLIGYDVLRHFDIVLVPDAGVVGLMAAGTAPTAGQSVKLRLSDENSSLLVDVTADGKNDVARAVLTIDTGATITVFPSMSAMMAAVPVDLRFTAVTVAVHGEKLEPGRYGLRPLRVGGVDVGNVLAFEGSGSGGAIGLLGNDVLRRYRTTIVSADAPGGPRLLLAELPRFSPVRSCDQRTLRLGDDDGTPCLRVRIKSIDTTVRDTLQRAMVYDDSGMAAMEHATQAAAPPRKLRDDACLEVTIRRGLAKERIEFVVGDDAGVLHGAVLSVIANIAAEGNGSTTACLSLPDNTRLLGLKPDASLHLAAVRFDDDVDPALCEEGICHWYSGP